MSASSGQVRYPQLAKEPIITGHSRGNPENRVLAKLIDFAIIEGVAASLGFFWNPVTWVLPVFYWCAIDRFGRGQSPGKWLLGLHTIELQRGMKPGLYHGLARNFLFMLLSVGLLQSGLWLWSLCIPAIVGLGLESYFIFSVRSGVRVGDVLGNTRVYDFKDEHTKFIEQFLKEEELA